jgi:hypothetical protein
MKRQTLNMMVLVTLSIIAVGGLVTIIAGAWLNHTTMLNMGFFICSMGGVTLLTMQQIMKGS